MGSAAPVAGALLGVLVSVELSELLRATTEWPLLCATAPHAARYLLILALLPFPRASALALSGIGRFLRFHGIRVGKGASGRLAPYPFDREKLQLVIGEVHAQDGARAEKPGWMVLPE